MSTDVFPPAVSGSTAHITSTLNSTTTPLGSGATYTGTGEQNSLPQVGVMVKTDNTGTLFFDFSNDGTNWDSTFPVAGFAIASGISEFHTAIKLGRYFRLRLVNDTGAQSYLRLTTYYGDSFAPSNAPLNQSPSSDQDAIFTQSVLIGEDATNTYCRTQVNEAGALLTTDFGLEVARGLYNGFNINTKFGRNPDIDTGTAPEDLWGGSGLYVGFNPTANENLETFSADAADAGTLVSSGTATGGSTTTIVDSGATFSSDGVAVGDVVLNDTQAIHGFVTAVTSETTLTVFRWNDGGSSANAAVSGDTYRVATTADTGAAVVKWSSPLDNTFTTQTSPYVIMNGTTGVTTTGDFYRLFKGRVILAGSDGVNADVITARQATTTANIFAQMPTTGQTTICAFTVPAGRLCVLKRTRASITRANGSAGSATIVLNSREHGGAWNGVGVFELQTGSQLSFDYIGGLVFLPGTDIKFSIASVSDNNTIADGALEYYFIDE